MAFFVSIEASRNSLKACICLLLSYLPGSVFEVSILVCNSDIHIFTVNFIAYNYVEIHLQVTLPHY